MLLSFLYLVRAEAFCGLTRAEAFCGLRLMPAPSPFLTGWVLAVLLIYTMLPFGPGTAGLLLARENAGRIGAGAHGTGVTVNGTAAVAGGGTALAEALDDAGVALALAGAGHVDLLALGENVGLDHVADFQLAAVLEAELLEVLDHAHAGLLQVTRLRLAELLLGHFLVAELDGLIAFLFLGHLGHDHAGACLDDGDRNDLAGLVEDLRHADLLANDGFLHSISS